MVEVFIAILFLVAFLSVAITQSNLKNQRISELISEKENMVLDLVQDNDTLRNEILEVIVPIDSFEVSFPTQLENTLNHTSLNSLNCSYKICSSDASCEMQNLPTEKEIYVESRFIFSNLEIYSPRKLNMFCFRK